MTAALDPIVLELINSKVTSIVEEMRVVLFHSGYSTVLRESEDGSAGLLDAGLRTLAVSKKLPFHFASFSAVMDHLPHYFAPEDFEEGDILLFNHPFEGNVTHTSDTVLLMPIFFKGQIVGYSGTLAHKPDLGGVRGLTAARDLWEEGLIIPPVKYHSRGVVNRDIERIIGANSRTPELVLGDIRGQVGSGRLGEQRLLELVRKYGKHKIEACYARLFELSEQRLRGAVAEWKDGRFEAERLVDDDGIELEKPVRIHVVVEKRGDSIHFDFSGSADQTKGPANIRPPLAQAAAAYVLISLVDPHMFICSGSLNAFTITAREGSVINPRFPAPVNTYNPTVHALVDAIFAALSHVVPRRARADGSGSRSIIIGGRSTYTGKGYVQYEILAGGAGARAAKDGNSGITSNQSNAKIAPVEIIESEFPTRLTRFELIRDSGGAGQFRGGLGLRREYINLADARFSIRSMKHTIPPHGSNGGGTGRTGDIWINPDTDTAKRLPTRYADYPLKEGDVFRLETPGGGGFGDPLTRDPAQVLSDVVQGYVSVEAAERDYGVVVDRAGPAVDQAATVRRRADKQKLPK
jgi:N-methylhydantoinase B